MNKKALIDELSAKFHKVGKIAPVELSPADIVIRQEEDITWYIAGVYEKADDRLIRKNVSFYVEAEGKVNEAAFYAEKLPIDSLARPAKTTFKDLVETKIEAKIIAGTIVKGIVDSVNEDKNFAFVTAYQLVTSEIITKKFFVYIDTSDKLHFTPAKETI